MAGLLDDWLGPQSQIGGLLGGFNDQANAALSNPMFNLGLHMMLARPGKQDEAIANGVKAAQNASVLASQRSGEAGMLGYLTRIGAVASPSAQATPTAPTQAAGGLLGGSAQTPDSPLMTDQGHPLPPSRGMLNAPSAAAPSQPTPVVQAGQSSFSQGGADGLTPLTPQEAKSLIGGLRSEATRGLATEIIKQRLDPRLPSDLRMKNLEIIQRQQQISGTAPTPDQSDYNKAVSQGYQGDLRSWMRDTKQQTPENTYDVTIGKARAERQIEIEKTGRAASGQIGSLRLMENMVNQPGFYSGFGGQMAKTANQALVALGVKAPNAASPAEVFSSLQNKLVLDTAGGSLGTGFSEGDRRFMENIPPSLANTPDGNRALIKIAQARANREVEIASMARDYRRRNGGRLDDGFEQLAVDYAEKNPLFTDFQLPGASSSGPQGGPVQTPAAGAVMDGYRFKGGNPADRSAWEKVR